jgi:hypothetical protein
MLLMMVLVVCVGHALGRQVAMRSTAAPALILLAAIAVSGITFARPNAGLLILVFSMLLSPELGAGRVVERAVVVRIDDILLLMVFVTWLARLAMRREMDLLRSTPLHIPLVLFLVVCGVSTALGIVAGTVPNPQTSLFYFLKYIEYFVLYVMFASQVRTRADINRYLMAIMLTAVIVGVVGYVQIASGSTRITAPFEGEGEPNTLAGYLIVIISLAGGFVLHHTSRRIQLASLMLCLFLIPPLIMTLSRGGYVAFVVVYFVLIAFASMRQRVVMAALLGLAVVYAPFMLPQSVQRRVTDTVDVSRRKMRSGQRFKLDASAQHRFDIIPWVLKKVEKRPLLGYGVTGVGLVDQQYALVLGEVGLIGMCIYLWTRWVLWAQSLAVLRRVRGDPMARSLTIGFMAGFAGLMLHSFAGNIFIIVRIMEPFWCLAAMVMVLPEVLHPKEDKTPPAPPTRCALRARLAAGY